jgi:serine phosphatase RsbU (regulator of sigma subunit)
VARPVSVSAHRRPVPVRSRLGPLVRWAAGGRFAEDPRAARLVAATLYATFVPLAVAVEYRQGAFQQHTSAALGVTAFLVWQLGLVLAVRTITERLGLVLVIAVPASFVGYGLILAGATDRLAACLVLPVLWTSLFMPGRLVVLSVLLNGCAGSFVEWRAAEHSELALLAGVRFGVYATAAVIVHALTSNIRAARNRYHEASRILQETLLPFDLPAVPGLETSGAYLASPTGFEVGGDFYDAFPYRNGGLAVWVGDVEGKGIEAAVVAALVRHHLRLGCASGTSLEDMLRAVNRALMAHSRTRFVTMAAAILVPDGSGADVRLVRAGHPPPVRVRGAVIDLLQPRGEALGIRERIDPEEMTFRLPPAAGLVFYTDGVTEARREGQLFGEERLRKAVGMDGTASARMACDAVVRAVTSFADPLRDDVAVLSIFARALQEPAATTAGVISDRGGRL